jgi:hypoxanthine-DNA glycosylase
MTDSLSETEIGFPPLVGASTRFLVLGSMPGVKSLNEQQYYAHSRNAFWPIMARLFGFDPTLNYEERCTLLVQSGVAVWDVLYACRRPGSLDANIDSASMETNDFRSFFQQYASISTVFFNGAKAESVFQQILPSLDEAQRLAISTQRLPSTSPAHASLSFEQKLAAWQTAFSA